MKVGQTPPVCPTCCNMQQLDSKQRVVSGTRVKGHHDWLVIIWKLVTRHVMLMYNRVSVLKLPEATVRNAVVNSIPIFAFNILTSHTHTNPHKHLHFPLPRANSLPSAWTIPSGWSKIGSWAVRHRGHTWVSSFYQLTSNIPCTPRQRTHSLQVGRKRSDDCGPVCLEFCSCPHRSVVSGTFWLKGNQIRCKDGLEIWRCVSD